MAALLMGGENPLEALVGKNAAEKALQPWWESIQDLLLYGLIGFGKNLSTIYFDYYSCKVIKYQFIMTHDVIYASFRGYCFSDVFG